MPAPRNPRLEAALVRVIPGTLEDLKKGRIDDEQLERMVAHRMPAIIAAMREPVEVPAPCAYRGKGKTCRAPSTTTINGVPYCDVHVRSAPRLAAPVLR